jgi:hypothetical protein
MTAKDLTCEVCMGESGGKFVGVASIPGVPMSIAWCDSCLKHDCAPSFVFDHDFLFVANGNLDALHPWALERETWVDGKYVTFADYVKKFTPADVEKAHAEYEAACRRLPPDDPAL